MKCNQKISKKLSESNKTYKLSRLKYNWKTSNKRPVKNIHLWKKLAELNNKHLVAWVWVKGHSNDPLNDLVDKMAKKAAKI